MIINSKISIVTPSYNQGHFIEQCIDSVLSQNYPNLEFIIIDGGSTDDSVEVIKKYADHLTHWVSEQDQGQSHAINKGIKICTGEIFNWLNSDDYLSPGSLDLVNAAFLQPGTNVFSGQSNIVENGEILMQSRGLDIYENDLAKTIGQARIDQPETFWKKSVVEKIGPLNNNLNFIMDRDWWVRYLLNFGLNGILQSNDILANFRLHAQSKTVDTKDDFNIERNSYFYALSQRYNLDRFNNLFSTLKFTSNFPLAEYLSSNDKDAIEHSLDYFCCLLAQEFYAKSNWKNFQKTLEIINFNHINSHDSSKLKKLHRRTKIIPAGIHRVLKN